MKATSVLAGMLLCLQDMFLQMLTSFWGKQVRVQKELTSDNISLEVPFVFKNLTKGLKG